MDTTSNEEVTRVAGRNAWKRALIDSLPREERIP
jgi:hypothetical protein